MISRERLEELIEQCATIYTSRFKKPEKYKLYKDYFIDKNNLCACNKSHTAIECVIKLDKLFETEEDAKWELEMTATRTETLKLPTWEEFYNSGKSVVFRDACGDIQELNQYSREIYINTQYCGFLTKENYIKACKLCLRLFKGEV